jgi:hypothetical protein
MGVHADNKLSMAIAIHTIKEVNRLDYNYQDYDHYKWVNYLAWKVLCHSPKYHPLSPPSTMNEENDNTSPPAINSVLTAESPFPPDSATINATIMEMTTNQYLPPAAVAAGLTTNISFSTVATSSAAVGDNNLSSTSLKKRAFVPADPALGGRGAETGGRIEREAVQRVERRAVRTDKDAEASHSCV